MIYELKKLMRIHIMCVLTLVVSNLFAQQIDFRQDTAFFKQKLPIYDQWLKDSGLGQVLKAHDMEVKKERFTLRIGFNFTDSDSAVEAWIRIKSDFEKMSPLTLEEQLFYKMTHIMEVPPSNARIHVSDNFDLTKLPNLDGKIYLKGGVIKSTLKPFRAHSKEINIFAFELKDNLRFTLKNFTNRSLVEKRKKIYNVIERNARKYFDRGEATFARHESDSILVFQVMNIKSEVLNLLVDPHELLTFIIKYTPKQDTIIVYCEIDGKYGSAIFRPRTYAGFREMEPEYEEELKYYTKLFVEEKIAIWLRKEEDETSTAANKN